jgi:hypothetical protein
MSRKNSDSKKLRLSTETLATLTSNHELPMDCAVKSKECPTVRCPTYGCTHTFRCY